MDNVKLNRAKNLIDYFTFIVTEFALKHKISMRQSFDYLNNYGGIDFLEKFYDVEHCENPAITLRSLQQICSKQGGNL
jgi:hypothetical protein